MIRAAVLAALGAMVLAAAALAAWFIRTNDIALTLPEPPRGAERHET